MRKSNLLTSFTWILLLMLIIGSCGKKVERKQARDTETPKMQSTVEEANHIHEKSRKSNKEKFRIIIISSYHREYKWSQETNKGLCDALIECKYLQDKKEADQFTAEDYIESENSVIKKLWMDTKRKKSKKDIAAVTSEFTGIVETFRADILLLGDDNAAQYIGNQFLDSEIPIVFWGVNNTPVKYGLIDSLKNPGHNVTGVYQSGYYEKSFSMLKKIKPRMKTFAILSDETTTGRSHTKKVEFLVRKNKIDLKLVATVSTDDFSTFKNKALELQKRVDAFFLAQYSGLKNENGEYVPTEEVASWYLKNITIPETTSIGIFVKEGMLCCSDDSGYNQGYEAIKMADAILKEGKSPSTFMPLTPAHGPLTLNKARADFLGIKIPDTLSVDIVYEQTVTRGD